jgi:hypothetical protein
MILIYSYIIILHRKYKNKNFTGPVLREREMLLKNGVIK